VLLIAPQTTEFATKVAVLAALAIVCAARPVGQLVLERGRPVRLPQLGGARAWLAGFAAVAAFAGLVVLAGIPARTTEAAAGPVVSVSELPAVTIVPSDDVSTEIDRETALKIASDLVTGLRTETEALATGDTELAATVMGGARLAQAFQLIARDSVVPDYHVERVRLHLEVGHGQGPPLVIAEMKGSVTATGPDGDQTGPAPFEETVQMELQDGRYLIVGSPDGEKRPYLVTTGPLLRNGVGLGRVRLDNVARHVGLDFRHGAFRFKTSADPVAMMGGGVCWLDFDNDGWLDLYAVNSHSIQTDVARWKERGGLPRNALYRNQKGRFVDVSRGSGADLQLRGNGCVAADFNGDRRTDLYVTATGYDALLWNLGGGKFAEGASAAGIDTYGWHTAASVADVNADGLPDLFVAGYADTNARVAGSAEPFPSNVGAVRDRLYLNNGPDWKGRSRFREIAQEAGIEASAVEHGLGSAFTDVNGDGRIDLYVANDLDPNRLYVNVPASGELGFRFEERGVEAGVADQNAGMGVAAADYSGDGRPDLFVTNSHRQLHGVFESRRGKPFADARPEFASVFDTTLAGWGASWADLDQDGDLDLAFANGAIPLTNLKMDAEPIKVLGALDEGYADVSLGVGLGPDGVNGRGLAVADYDNDGDLDIAVASIAGRLVLLRSSGADGHWLQVKLDTFAPGAVVTATLPDGRRLVREVKAGTSYLSSEDPRVHFGLGDTTRVRELVVRYPDGRETRLTGVRADRLVTVGR
jgi:ASPIC and UnbV/FG-GAP-like repeat